SHRDPHDPQCRHAVETRKGKSESTMSGREIDASAAKRGFDLDRLMSKETPARRTARAAISASDRCLRRAGLLARHGRDIVEAIHPAWRSRVAVPGLRLKRNGVDPCGRRKHRAHDSVAPFACPLARRA